MSYTIVPNPKFSGASVLLVLRDRSGQTELIECHNRATAVSLARTLNAKHRS